MDAADKDGLLATMPVSDVGRGTVDLRRVKR